MKILSQKKQIGNILQNFGANFGEIAKRFGVNDFFG